MNSFQSWLVKGITQEFEKTKQNKTKQNKTLPPEPNPQGFWFNMSGLRFEHGHFQSCLSDSNLRSWLRVATLDAVRDSWRQMPLTISSRKSTVLTFLQRENALGKKRFEHEEKRCRFWHGVGGLSFLDLNFLNRKRMPLDQKISKPPSNFDILRFQVCGL